MRLIILLIIVWAVFSFAMSLFPEAREFVHKRVKELTEALGVIAGWGMVLMAVFLVLLLLGVVNWVRSE